MILNFFHTTFYEPLYNALVFLIAVVPYHDVGIALILLTLLVKFILLPLSIRSSKTQLRLREVEPKIAEIKEKYKENKEEMARKTMELYREQGINPFSSFFLLLLQLPVIISLYYVFAHGGLPSIHPADLYRFVTAPISVNMEFLGFIDMVKRNLPLALLAGITQYIQTMIVLPKLTKKGEGSPSSFQDEFARSMQLQMKYILPVIMFFVSYGGTAAVALYFTVSNIFGILQELFIKRLLAQQKKATEVVVAN